MNREAIVQKLIDEKIIQPLPSCITHGEYEERKAIIDAVVEILSREEERCQA